jgi:hypothetical protein
MLLCIRGWWLVVALQNLPKKPTIIWFKFDKSINAICAWISCQAFEFGFDISEEILVVRYSLDVIHVTIIDVQNH